MKYSSSHVVIGSTENATIKVETIAKMAWLSQVRNSSQGEEMGEGDSKRQNEPAPRQNGNKYWRHETLNSL